MPRFWDELDPEQGGYGDPALGSAEIGEPVYNRIVDDLRALVETFARGDVDGHARDPVGASAPGPHQRAVPPPGESLSGRRLSRDAPRTEREVRSRTVDALDRAAALIARRSLRLRRGEHALLITDTKIEPEVRASLRAALEETGAHVRDVVISFETPGVAMELPEPEVAAEARAVVAAVSQSLTYNRTLAELRARGGRVLSMPRITRETLERVADSDFDGMIACTRQVTDYFASGPSRLELRSPAGTQLSLDISGNQPDPIDGVVEDGEIDQLPAGVVSIVGRQARGEIVVTGPISFAREFDAPIRLRIEDGSIVSIEGGEAARRLESIFNRYEDRAVRHCPAEVGIGSNPSVVYQPTTRFVPEFARAAGMIHVGIGDDHFFPGGNVTAPLHGDFLLPDAEVWLDGRKVEVRC